LDFPLPVRSFRPDKTLNFLILAATIENFLLPFKWFGIWTAQVLNLWRKIWKSAGKTQMPTMRQHFSSPSATVAVSVAGGLPLNLKGKHWGK